MSGSRTLLLAALLLVLVVVVAFFIPSNWEGVDVTVVQGKAKEAGVEAATPFINITGDFQLFLFTVSGAVGGFIIGYSWKSLFGTPAKPETPSRKES
ncbi:MAG: cobalt ABC transporter permease [Chloroflexota bacterium]